MSENDIKNKNIVLCEYLTEIIKDYTVKAEYSTNDDDKKVIVVQETSGSKEIFYDANPIYNYYNVDVYGDNIKDCKDTSVIIGNLIGKNIYFNWENNNEEQKWQIIVKQFANPRTIAYQDIRRVAYTSTLQCIVNRIA